MTDKVQKIRKEVERIQLYTQSEVLKQILDYIDKVQEEPVSIWHDASEKPKRENLLIETNDGRIIHRQSINNYGMVKKWAYISVLLNLDNSCNVGKNLKEEPVSEGRDIFDNCIKSEEKFILPQKISGNINCENCLYSSACALGDIKACVIDKPVNEKLEEADTQYGIDNFPSLCNGCKHVPIDAFKVGAQWQKAKDEYITEDLGDYISELSKQFPEVSFAKLSRIAVRVAKWQRTKLMKEKGIKQLTNEEIEKMLEKVRKGRKEL